MAKRSSPLVFLAIGLLIGLGASLFTLNSTTRVQALGAFLGLGALSGIAFGWKIKPRKRLTRAQQLRRANPISAELRARVLAADNFTCQARGCPNPHTEDLTVDHIIPITRGGTTEWDNLRTTCRSCNSSKGNRLGWTSRSGPRPRSRPSRPRL